MEQTQKNEYLVFLNCSINGKNHTRRCRYTGTIDQCYIAGKLMLASLQTDGSADFYTIEVQDAADRRIFMAANGKILHLNRPENEAAPAPELYDVAAEILS